MAATATVSVLTTCFLVHILAGVDPRDVYPQSPSAQTLDVGKAFKVDCHTGLLGSGQVFWYKRQHRQLQLIYTAWEYGIPAGRFSGQINVQMTIYSMFINKVQRNDSGWYYCSARKYSGMALVFGNGSKLIVAGSPRVILLTPPTDEVRGMEVVQLMCLVQNAASHSPSIRWNVSGRDMEGWEDSGTIDQDGSHVVISHISVPVKSWRVCNCALRINSSQTLTSKYVVAQRGTSPWDACISLRFVGFPVAIILLAIVIVIVYKRCKKRGNQHGDGDGDGDFTDARTGRAGNESVYAGLRFNAARLKDRRR
ncbi:immunoglobulin kappa light chain-like [Leucoraja erinacea]|uniref:immunoglobulin kappa light chain-like n=1 Tax=Leucoraja erinaceus TaxID=7782 RepID=UPI002454BEA5|nr:immunoglobulin kappa light chain-like [Leucoraja erinacea]